MQEISLSLAGVLAIILALGVLSAPFKTMRLIGTGILTLGPGIYALARAAAMVAVGLSGAAIMIAVKAVRGARRWSPAPEQVYEPASRAYPAAPKKGEQQGAIYENSVDRDQPRLVEVKTEEFIKIGKIGSNRPVRK